MTGLSVVTLVKGRPGHLAELVEGLRRGGQAPDELIIIDMDDPPITPLAAPLAVSFPVRVARLHDTGLPLAAARNRGAALARHEMLLFLDVDCIPRRDLTAAMAAALQDHDALICAEVRYLGQHEARDGWREEALLATALPHPARQFPAAGLRREDNAGLFWSLLFGIRRERFFALGGFDGDFTGYGAEDTDFGFRAAQAGLPLYFLGGTGAFHQHHGVAHPPLQHFSDILRNARLFHRRWGFWPMRDWLSDFAALGLVRFDGGALELIRLPDPAEIRAARRDGNVRF